MTIDSDSAAENLRVIRTLMERATIYRAISGPAALFGGSLALLVGGWMASGGAAGLAAGGFLGIWIGILVIVGGFNLWLLGRRRDDSGADGFVSSGMRVALRAGAPALAAGGVLGYFVISRGDGSLALCALLWVMFYGLALLAMAGFAPRSIRWLGLLFFAVAMIALAVECATGHTRAASDPGDDLRLAGAIMAATFGALHIFYGAAIVLRPRALPDIPDSAD